MRCTTAGCEREGVEAMAYPMYANEAYFVGWYCSPHAADVGEMRGARPAVLCAAFQLPTPDQET
jgi:hypothetical protein